MVDGGGSHRSNWPYGYQWGEYDSGKREGGVKGSGTIYVYGGFPEAEKRHRPVSVWGETRKSSFLPDGRTPRSHG